MSEGPDLNFTRRQVLLGLSSTMVMGELFMEEFMKDDKGHIHPPEGLDKKTFGQIVGALFEEKGTSLRGYSDTVLETCLLSLAEGVAVTVFKKLGIDTGNGGMSESEEGQAVLQQLREGNTSQMIETGIIKPMWEEFMYRLALSKLFVPKDGKLHLEVGVPVSILFAGMHNLIPQEGGSVALSKKIPLNQFMAGLFYWYLMRKRGYTHAALAHAGQNSGIIIADLLNQRFSKTKDNAETGTE